MNLKKKSTIFSIVFVISVSIFAVLPFFHPGFFPMHDDTQVARVFEMGKSLKDGMFPVRWVEDLGYGYGYPIFNFYAPLAYYIGGFFVVVGLNALLATKIMFVLGIILAGITMYLFAKEFWGELGGIISAVVYEYALYHAVDIYVRGDVGEFWAFAFIPLTFWGIFKIFQVIQNEKLPLKIKSFWRWTVVGSLGYAGVILSHNLTAMMITPFLLACIIVLFVGSKKEKRFTVLHQMLHIIFFGILLSAFYWLPAILESKYTNVLGQIGGGADFHTHFICLSQLWSSPWGYGGSTGGCVDGISFMVGKISLLLAATGLITLLRRKQTRWGGILFGTGIIISIFLCMQLSVYVWDLLRPMAFFQYPWRFLLMVSFFLALLCGAITVAFKKVNQKYLIIVTAIIIMSVIIFQGRYFIPQKINPVTSDYYTNQKMLTFTTSKISDEYLPKDFLKPQNFSQVPKSPFSLIDGAGVITDIKNNTTQKSAQVAFVTSGKLYIANAPFPAWHVFLDAKEIPYATLKNGFLIGIPKGNYLVTVVFRPTRIELISGILSLAGLLILILGIIYLYRPYAYSKTDR